MSGIERTSRVQRVQRVQLKPKTRPCDHSHISHLPSPIYHLRYVSCSVRGKGWWTFNNTRIIDVQVLREIRQSSPPIKTFRLIQSTIHNLKPLPTHEPPHHPGPVTASTDSAIASKESPSRHACDHRKSRKSQLNGINPPSAAPSATACCVPTMSLRSRSPRATPTISTTVVKPTSLHHWHCRQPSCVLRPASCHPSLRCLDHCCVR